MTADRPPKPDRLETATVVAQAISDLHGEDVIALDVREVTSFADTVILATGRSDRQVRAITDAVREASREAGLTLLGVEGYDEGRWVLVDLADLVLHIFLAEVRKTYDLERLWSDAPVLVLGLDEADHPDEADRAS
jgi:ribosome-associated protein